ncbi:MAG TPA: HAMP domain-containing sensor histidine kinase [Aggregatilineales bacterium]|nr:HAMP domain-containing histidine kinase [Anaerolineales bacterium]HRE47837.1 HAMP domain-containing sensor histidine kinase [Aggregatilineales bacterium]
MTTASQPHDLTRQNAILSRLLDVSLVLNLNVALKPILGYILDAVCEITECEAASILLYNRNNDELRFAASNTPGSSIEDLQKIPVPMSGSIAGQIVRENRPIIIQNAADDARIYRSVDESIGFRTQMLLGVPMHVRGNVIGVVEALNRRSGEWTQDNLTHLTILASHAAVAISNARQTEALRKANEELSKLDKIKNDFIAIASHELRTPLSVILGYASFLKDEAQGEASDHAAAVLNSALHLRNLIEDMTNLRYLQIGKIELAMEHAAIGTLMQAAHNDLKSLAEAKEHRLEIDLGNTNVLVYMDRTKVAMAIINLLNNAIKFTPNKGTIRLYAEPHGEEIWVRVSDNGIGLPADQLEKVFEEFHQVADHMTRKHNGMGLGLSIARGFAEAHHGRVWAESAGVGKGATFTMALPIKGKESS